MAGLAGAALSGLLYLASLDFLSAPHISVAVLLAGRAILGAAESFIITGATTWGLARVGAHNAGKVIAWMGTAMFAALAVGAPLGTAIYERGGFGAVSAGATLAPLATLVLIAPLPPAAPSRKSGPGLLSVAKIPACQRRARTRSAQPANRRTRKTRNRLRMRPTFHVAMVDTPCATAVSPMRRSWRRAPTRPACEWS